MGTQLIETAKERIALVAKTPVIITGPRPYGETVRNAWEKRQFDRLIEIIETTSDQAGPDVRCVGSVGAMRRDLADHASSVRFRKEVKHNLGRLFRATERTQKRISLYWTHDSNPMTYLIVDNTFLLWFKDDGDKFCLKRTDPRIANSLFSQARTDLSHSSLLQVLEMLGDNGS